MYLGQSFAISTLPSRGSGSPSPLSDWNLYSTQLYPILNFWESSSWLCSESCSPRLEPYSYLLFNKNTKVDGLDPTKLGPAEVAAADRPDFVTIYFMKQGTNVQVAEVCPIVEAEGGEVFALNPIPP